MIGHKTKTAAFRSGLCIALIVLAAALLLTSCGGDRLSGTYSSEGFVAQTFTFSGDSVTMSAFGINANGTYKIEGDTITISYTLFGSDYVWSQPFSKSGNAITISGTRFVKQ